MQTGINIMAVVDEDFALGCNGKLLCHLPKDLERFKQYTLNQIVVMGRKTFESLPKRPLPYRKNIVITRDPDFHCSGCDIVHSIEEAMDVAKKIMDAKEAGGIYIIGGGQIYAQFIQANAVDRILLTRIHHKFPADTYFPEIPKEFKIIHREEIEDNGYATEFLRMEKI